MFLEYVSIRKALRPVSRVHAGQVGASQRSPSSATPSVQSVHDSWKGPDTRHAIGVWVFEWRAGLEGARSGVHHKRG